MSTTPVTTCRFCPGDTPADGTLVDVCGETSGVCSDCLTLIWSRDWDRIESRVWDYQMSDATRLERLRGGIRARRVARTWARCVRSLTTGSTPRERARAARRRRIRDAAHTLTGIPTQRPGEDRLAYTVEPWMTWLRRAWTPRITTKGA